MQQMAQRQIEVLCLPHWYMCLYFKPSIRLAHSCLRGVWISCGAVLPTFNLTLIWHNIFHQDLNFTIYSTNHQHCFDSVCHLFFLGIELSGLCSFLSGLLWIRDHPMRLTSLLLSPNVLKKVEFHVLALVYWIHIWAHCSLLCLLKKKFHGHALWEHLALIFIYLFVYFIPFGFSFYSLLKSPFT